MTNKQIFNDPYIKSMTQLLQTTKDKSKKVHIIKCIELKTALLKGEISQEEYNDKLFNNLEKAPRFNEVVKSKKFWSGLYDFVCNLPAERFSI